MNKINVRYYEIQYYHWIVNSMMLVLFLANTGIYGYGFIKQIIFGKSWGFVPLSNLMLVLLTLLFVALFPLLFLLFFKQTIILDDDYFHIIIGFIQTIHKKIRLREIISCAPVTFSPIRDFGGWGIRRGGGNTFCYTTQGKIGVKVMTKRKQYVISTKNPEKVCEIVGNLTN